MLHPLSIMHNPLSIGESTMNTDSLERKAPEPVRKTSSVRRAAVILGVSPGHLYGAIRRGEVPHIKIGERVLIPNSVIDRILDGAK
jgi:excisionase family DNA binding protein